VAPPTRVEANAFPDAPAAERDLVEMVSGYAIGFEDGVGRELRDRCVERYRQYRGFRRFRDAWIKAGPNDKDGMLYDAKSQWGAHLHIPLSFRTIETMVPRAIAQRPRMLYLPREERWAENVASVKLLIDAQQDQIDIDLPFQAVMRSGRIYGLGIGKSYWRKDVITKRGLRRSLFRPGAYVPDKARQVTTFDDPMFEDVDIFDFGWDWYGHDMSTCDWTFHRIWMSTEKVMARLQSGAWNTASAQLLTEDKVRSMGGSGQKYDEIWRDRMIASGFSNYTMTARGEQLHEVLEFHDGRQQVASVLDRQVLVQQAESACAGLSAFQVYRPTPLQKQMVGIGDLEPLEHIQRELDTLRSQRRDAATLALAAGYIYDTSAIDEEDLVWGPNAAIGVRNQRPGDAIMPIPIRDVPGSSWQEEQVIRTDFDAIPGIQDALDNSPGGSAGTATQAQLMQAALGARIELSSRRFEIEVVRQAARCFLAMDQRMILEQRSPLRVADHGMDLQEAAETGRWRWVEIGPGELRGEFEIIPEGGSMAARNVPQDRQDAIQMMSLFGQNPFVDPRRPLMRALQLFGVEDPESWLKQQAPPIPPTVLDRLKEAGVDPTLIDYVVQSEQQQDPTLGPSVQDVNGMMGGGQTQNPEAVAA